MAIDQLDRSVGTGGTRWSNRGLLANVVGRPADGPGSDFVRRHQAHRVAERSISTERERIGGETVGWHG